LQSGKRIFVKGKVEVNSYTGLLQISVTESEILDSKDDNYSGTGVILPVYSLTSGLQQVQMRRIAKEIMTRYAGLVSDPLPESLRISLKIPDLAVSIKTMHFPVNRELYLRSRFRMVFEEFFYFQLLLAVKRHYLKKDSKSEGLVVSGPLIDSYLDLLPYKLTDAQNRVINEIRSDVMKCNGMNRLLQGDVGSGKTDVAVITLLFAINTNKNGAIMAPTEVLAEQHYYKFKKYLKPLGINVVLLKGRMKAKERKEALYKIENEKGIVVVGTHALIQDSVKIPDLGVAVIDEQHRFGVFQRMSFKKWNISPHCLFMTATPIPRTFMLTCYGDLDKSIIDQLPPGRISTRTCFIREQNLDKVYDICKEELKLGRQLYVVYPLIEESEKMDLKSAIDGWEFLKDTVFSDYKVGLVHGKLTSVQKAEVMDSFKENKIQVLVATTVIEVGIDVPNASVMIIQHAERFGLSQLHQLRGRVGRGAAESICFLVADPKTEGAAKRIKSMLDTSDGFKIAEYDLAIRGPGDILGTRQAGMPDFNIADLIKDEKVLHIARAKAVDILKKDPEMTKKEHIPLRNILETEYSEFYEARLN
ncbi:MAG: ATP-dependent DNA helicase RecG, partial [bacterium]|nr:ATP-dependent DNA helicase RecG [bacterium]